MTTNTQFAVSLMHKVYITMSYARVMALTSLTMIAFAGNSLLCRTALKHTSIDAASFTRSD